MGLKSKPLTDVRTLPLEEVGKQDLVRINLNVPKQVRQAWKATALRQEKTLTEIIVEAMSRYVGDA